MKFLVTFLLTLLVVASQAQNNLRFEVVDRGKGKTSIAWLSDTDSCVQVSIQMSYDSVKFFRTIFSSLSPELRQNGYIYQRPITQQTFFRIFYVVQGGKYFFTESKKAVKEATLLINTNKEKPNINWDKTDREIGIINSNNHPLKSNKLTEEPFATIRTKDSTIGHFSGEALWRFKDSIYRNTKDTLFAVFADELLLARYKPVEVFKPSAYVFTGKDGYLHINLPMQRNTNYSIKFYTNNNNYLFEIKGLKEPSVSLDKGNFYQAGWYKFELFENGNLKEKNKFFIVKDF